VVQVSISGWSKSIFCSPEPPESLQRPPVLFFNDSRTSFPEINQPGSETDHSPAPSVEVGNVLSSNAIPPVRLNGVDRSTAALRMSYRAEWQFVSSDYSVSCV
jgi:hypothetical protein